MLRRIRKWQKIIARIRIKRIKRTWKVWPWADLEIARAKSMRYVSPSCMSRTLRTNREEKRQERARDQ